MLKRLLLALLLVLAPSPGIAEPPMLLSHPEQYTRPGVPKYGHTQVLPATVTSSAGIWLQAANGTYTAVERAHLFKWGTVIEVSCAGDNVTFCWTMGIGTFPDTAGNMNDRYTTGAHTQPGPCFRVNTGNVRKLTLTSQIFRDPNQIGRRVGFCRGNANTIDWPCRQNNDCSSGGTCNTSCWSGSTLLCSDASMSPFDQIKGAFLVGVAATVTCWVSEDI